MGLRNHSRNGQAEPGTTAAATAALPTHEGLEQRVPDRLGDPRPTVVHLEGHPVAGVTGLDLYRLTGYPSPEKFLAGRESRSPVDPATPETPIDRRELYDRYMKFTFGAPPVFPAGYLWPTNVYYMGYLLYPLGALAPTPPKPSP